MHSRSSSSLISMCSLLIFLNIYYILYPFEISSSSSCSTSCSSISTQKLFFVEYYSELFFFSSSSSSCSSSFVHRNILLYVRFNVYFVDIIIINQTELIYISMLQFAFCCCSSCRCRYRRDQQVSESVGEMREREQKSIEKRTYI